MRYLNNMPGFVSASAGGATPKYSKIEFNFNKSPVWIFDCVHVEGSRWRGKIDSHLLTHSHALAHGEEVEFDVQTEAEAHQKDIDSLQELKAVKKIEGLTLPVESVDRTSSYAFRNAKRRRPDRINSELLK